MMSDTDTDSEYSSCREHGPPSGNTHSGNPGNNASASHSIRGRDNAQRCEVQRNIDRERESSGDDVSFEPKIFFRLATGDWESFTERLDLHFFVRKISEADMKRAILLTHVDEETYKLFKNLCVPDKPATKSYDDLIKLFPRYLEPPIAEMTRLLFNRATQEQNETIADFSKRLRDLALGCNFALDQLSQVLHNQFVCGISDATVRIKLFKRSNLTFYSALKQAIAREHPMMKDKAGAHDTLVPRNFNRENFALDRHARQHELHKSTHLGAATTGTFSFGISTTTTASIFGQSSAATTSVFTALPTTAILEYEIPPATAHPKCGIPSTTAPPTFGIPSTKATSIFGTPSWTVRPAIKTSSTTAPQTFGTPIFGTPSMTVPAVIRTSSTTAPPAIETLSTTATFTFGKPSTTVPPSIKTSSTTAPQIFGTPAMTVPPTTKTSSTTATPTFGTPSTTVPPSIKTLSTTATFTFGQPSTTATFTFGKPSTTVPPSIQTSSTTEPQTFGTPTFGTPSMTAPPAIKTSSTTATRTSGTPSMTVPPAIKTSSTTATPTFGTPSMTVPPAIKTLSTTATPTFGTPSMTVPPAIKTSSTTATTTFGTPSMTVPPAIKTSSTTATTTFGTPSMTVPPAIKTSSTTATTTFGTPSMTVPPAIKTSSTTATPTFGTPSMTVPPAIKTLSTTATPTFGTPSMTVPPAIKTSSTTATTTFGTPSMTVPPAIKTSSTTATTTFGTPSMTVPPAIKTSSTTATTTFGTPSMTVPPAIKTSSTTATPTFGTPSMTVPPAIKTLSTTATPTFGTPSMTAPPAIKTSSTTATPTFGTPSMTVPPAIKTSSTTATTTFGTPSMTVPPAIKTSSTTATPTFGTPSMTVPPAIKTSSTTATTTFGTPSMTVPPAIKISSTTATPTFGTPSMTAPPAIKTSSTTATTTFGTPSMTVPPAMKPSSTTATPTFGTPSMTVPPAIKTLSTTATTTFGTPSMTAPPAIKTSSTTATTTFGTPSMTVPPAIKTSSTTATPTFGTPSMTVPPAIKTLSTTAPQTFGTPIFGTASMTVPPAIKTPSTTAALTFVLKWRRNQLWVNEYKKTTFLLVEELKRVFCYVNKNRQKHRFWVKQRVLGRNRLGASEILLTALALEGMPTAGTSSFVMMHHLLRSELPDAIEKALKGDERCALDSMRLVDVLLVLLFEGRSVSERGAAGGPSGPLLPKLIVRRLDSTGEKSQRQLLQCIRSRDTDALIEAIDSGGIEVYFMDDIIRTLRNWASTFATQEMVEFLKDDPETASVYLKRLLPVFCDTFQSTMFSDVRKASLSLIRKMLHYIQSELLIGICGCDGTGCGATLVEVIATVLDNKEDEDGRLVVLQMIQDLMVKGKNEFLEHFMRLSVITKVAVLATEPESGLNQSKEKQTMKDARELFVGRAYHWRDWCVCRDRYYVYVWSEFAILEFWNGSTDCFRFILGDKLLTFDTSYPLERGTLMAEEARVKFLERFQGARTQVKPYTVSQPIFSRPSKAQLIVGNWTLSSTCEAELSVTIPGRSTGKISLRKDLPGFLFKPDSGAARYLTCETSLGPEFAAGWADDRGDRFRSESEAIKRKVRSQAREIYERYFKVALGQPGGVVAKPGTNVNQIKKACQKQQSEN